MSLKNPNSLLQAVSDVITRAKQWKHIASGAVNTKAMTKANRNLMYAVHHLEVLERQEQSSRSGSAEAETCDIPDVLTDREGKS